MRNNEARVPGFFTRITSVWSRHSKVYMKNFLANGFPPFMEPLIFLVGIGIGLGTFIKEMDGVPYIQFLATGLIISTAMMTSAFECSYGTFIRMEFDKVYDGMFAAPMTAGNMMAGELLWAGTKGFFFSLAVLIVVFVFGIMRNPWMFLAPFAGFLTGIMFASFSLLITSVVQTIDQFSFYFSGFLSPMFFFSGVVFPVSNLPTFLRPIAEALPLTHPIRIVRAICFGHYDLTLLWDMAYILLFIGIFGFLGMKRLIRKIVF